MPASPEELQQTLDSVGDPPEVGDLVSGSGVPAETNVQPCDQVDCDDIAATLADLQDWLDDAQARLRELQGYTQNDELEWVRNEAELAKGHAEENGEDGSEFQDIIDSVNSKMIDAATRAEELNDQIIIESQTKNALDSTHTHCCVEYRWYHDWMHGAS